MKLLTKPLLAQLIKNGQMQAKVKGTDAEHDFVPVVKLFDPFGAGTWLLTEIEPDDHDIAWGLCDLGMGCAEFGTVSLTELQSIRMMGRPRIERDLYWQPHGRISQYIDAAQKAGRIVPLPNPLIALAEVTAKANATPPASKTFTYLQDPAHGWLIVIRSDIEGIGLKPSDFSRCTYVNREVFALEEDCDMPRFLRRMDELELPYKLHEQSVNGNAYVRGWASNQAE